MSYHRPTVIVIDSDPAARDALSRVLAAAGFHPVSTATGSDGLRWVAQARPAAVILDLALPDQDGKQVILALRASSRVPIVVLTARDAEAEKILALDFGADDYIVKPFSAGELLARIRSALRRWPTSEATYGADRLVVGELELQLGARTAKVAGRPIELTAMEWELLVLLARNRGRVMTYAEIASGLQRPCDSKHLASLRVVISRLRLSLGDALVLKNVHQVGYCLTEAVDGEAEVSTPSLTQNVA